MTVRTRLRGWGRALLSGAVMVTITGALTVATGAVAHADTQLPCDIYAAAGTPCVAAHSTTRALYAGYDGPLYQVTRASDGTSADIGVLSTGGVADAAAQDSFCANTTCTITTIYDQSPEGNNLTIEGPGGNGGQDAGAPANALPVSVDGQTAYGVEISAGMGYRDDSTSGVATNGAPEGMYMVASGTHVNSSCCFDYGNAETNNDDNGAGHMDAVNLSTICGFSPCYGSGPWVQADMENGLYQSDTGGSQSSANTGTGAIGFATAWLKNNGQNYFELQQGNAQSGGLTETWGGPEPSGYSPMHQEGAIVLGTGGDNSNGSIGSFFEGVMTAGMPSDAADAAVQANIVSVGYGLSDGVPTGTLQPGSAISLRATTACCTSDYIRHYNGDAIISPISSSSSTLDWGDSTWWVRPGLADSSCVSFESYNYPGDYLRHYDWELYRQPDDGTQQLAEDATFCPQAGNSGQYTSFESYNYPGYYIRHYDGTVYIADDGGTANPWDTATLWPDDTTFDVSPGWAFAQ
jgi:non-reducing end alpha-L-arabinofuranosidase